MIGLSGIYTTRRLLADPGRPPLDNCGSHIDSPLGTRRIAD